MVTMLTVAQARRRRDEIDRMQPGGADWTIDRGWGRVKTLEHEVELYRHALETIATGKAKPPSLAKIVLGQEAP